MNKTNYRGTTFTLPSRKKFWKQCGIFDSILEYQECAHISLQQLYLDEFSKSGISHASYIQTRAHELNLMIGNFNIDNYEDYLYGCYLIPSLGLFDAFLDDYITDVNELCLKLKINKGRKYNTKNTLTKFDQILKGLKKYGVNLEFEPWNVDVYNYYRTRRNSIAHGLSASSYDKTLIKALKWVPTIKNRYPNWASFLDSSGRMTFYDFLLSTTNLKNISDILTFGIEKHLDWKKIGKSHPNFINYSEMNRLHMFKNQRIEHIRHMVQMKYAVTLPDAICECFL